MSHLIWQLVDSKSIGGIETHIVHLFRALKKYEVTTTIVQLRNFGSHPVFHAKSNKDLETSSCDSISEIFERVKVESPDLIHAHGTIACLFAKYIKLRYGVPVVCTYHSGEINLNAYGIYEWLNQKTAFFGKSIAVSKKISRRLIGKTLVVENFIPAPKYTPPGHNNGEIAFVGRLSHEKGPERFIKLAEALPNEKFSIYGNGPMLESLEDTRPINTLIRTDVSSMDNHWQNIKILCITSRSEGLPLVALEAMANGVCVLSFDVGGLPELITDSVNGFIVKDQNLAAMESALKSISKMPTNEFNAVSNRAITTIRARYSSHAILPKILSSYPESIQEALT